MWTGNIQYLPGWIQNIIEFDYETYRSFYYKAKLNDEQLEELVDYVDGEAKGAAWDLSKSVDSLEEFNMGDLIMCIHAYDESKSFAGKISLISLCNEKEAISSTVVEKAEIFVNSKVKGSQSYFTFGKYSNGTYYLKDTDYFLVKAPAVKLLVEQYQTLNKGEKVK